jgi:enamine deaminase RidA (YjgF/YER057c/UK114 family)
VSAIRRDGVTPRWADRVVWRDTVYLVEVPPDPEADTPTQVAAMLASVERQLQEVGSDKSRLLMATIYLVDFADAECFNRLWEGWLPAGSAPARACVRAGLAHPGYRVEIAVVAALK